MKVAVLGTGNVGRTIGSKLISLGHTVVLGSRSADNEAGKKWAGEQGGAASVATFADAAARSEMVFNCTSGAGSLQALKAAGSANLAGKILIDVANPLDFSKGMPPTLSVCNDTSLGEQIQAAYPEARVVKALNTINCDIMVEPSLVPGEHSTFVCGNDAEAKATVAGLLKEEFGWPSVIDLGDITASRGTEMYLPLWLRLWGAVGSAKFNVQIRRA